VAALRLCGKGRELLTHFDINNSNDSGESLARLIKLDSLL